MIQLQNNIKTALLVITNNMLFYLKSKVVVGEVSVIDNGRIQALRGNKTEKKLHLQSGFLYLTLGYNNTAIAGHSWPHSSSETDSSSEE